MQVRSIATTVSIAASLLAGSAAFGAATPADLLAGYRAAANNAAPSAERGQRLFTTTHGREWSCASCHRAPTQIGQHAGTGKPIAPLAPAGNAERFTDAAKTEKWFRRNCSDVIGRECNAGEKADVLAWLMTLKP